MSFKQWNLWWVVGGAGLLALVAVIVLPLVLSSRAGAVGEVSMTLAQRMGSDDGRMGSSRMMRRPRSGYMRRDMEGDTMGWAYGPGYGMAMRMEFQERLEELLGAVEQDTGEEKIAAMENLLREMVEQRREMIEHHLAMKRYHRAPYGPRYGPMHPGSRGMMHPGYGRGYGPGMYRGHPYAPYGPRYRGYGPRYPYPGPDYGPEAPRR